MRTSGIGNYNIIDGKRKGGHKGTIRCVTGRYTKCARCGKKLSTWKRF